MRIVYPKKIAIGVDIGGTKIKAGLVDINGQIIGIPESIRTLAHEPGEMIIEQLTLLIRRMIQQADGAELIGIGIGSTGPLDINKGIILECNNLPTLHNYPLHKKIESTFGLPVKLDNDANAMMLGEALWGAGRNLNSILGITLGTGLGAAIVVNRKIIRGATGLCRRNLAVSIQRRNDRRLCIGNWNIKFISENYKKKDFRRRNQ